MPCGVRSDFADDMSDLIFTELSTRPDAGLFRLPSGLEEISEDQFDEEDFSF